MICSIIGSHGVGKTSTINKMKEIQPEWLYFSESSREIMPLLGYPKPYDFVDRFGIAFYESIIISQWSFLKNLHSFYDSRQVLILDRSPLDNLAYYYLDRRKNEMKYEEVLNKLARYYLQFIDVFILFPIGVFELVPDQMQKKETQSDLHDIILSLIQTIPQPCYTIQTTTIDSRANELIEYIKGW